MTEQFGTAIKRDGRVSQVELLSSYDVAKAMVEVVNGMVSEERLATERLVVVRVQEVGPNGQRKIEARQNRQDAWEAAHPRGTTVQGTPCTCGCHVEMGLLHFAPCCHAPYFDKTDSRE
ncbi:hypothetical protein SEA_ZOOMAN_309 [Microbacterium phage Zooman]|nr:hypothetical protein SEA_ZOOMAN_309 [Microbacterium phage Zooman]